MTTCFMHISIEATPQTGYYNFTLLDIGPKGALIGLRIEASTYDLC